MIGTLEERLRAKVDRRGPDECWPWTGAKGGTGTCMITLNRKSLVARRVLWEIERGPIPPENVITDTCGDNGCMNSAHFALLSRNQVEVFWSRVEKTDGCWLWTGWKNPRGYGVLYKGKGYGRRGGKHVQVHRLSYTIHFGAIPTDDGIEWCVCHRCDNPSCVRPDHLFLGTDADNMADCKAKGRNARGEKHRIATAAALAKARAVPRPLLLSPEQHVDIQLKHASGFSIREIAEAYGMKESTIYKASKRSVAQTGSATDGK